MLEERVKARHGTVEGQQEEEMSVEETQVIHPEELGARELCHSPEDIIADGQNHRKHILIHIKSLMARIIIIHLMILILMSMSPMA